MKKLQTARRCRYTFTMRDTTSATKVLFGKEKSTTKYELYIEIVQKHTFKTTIVTQMCVNFSFKIIQTKSITPSSF